MRWVRTWLPLAIIAGGVVAIIAGGGSQTAVEGGMFIISAGLSVWLLNFFFRVGVKGDRERDEEDRAREFYDAHGHWPDESPPEAEPPEPHAPENRPPPRPGPHRDGPRRRPERPVRRGHRRGP